MKYRLKKDLPDLEAGEIFDDTDSFGHENSSMFDSGGVYRFEKDNIKNFNEWFEEVNQPGWKKPEFDNLYYYVDDAGDIRSKFWTDGLVDKIRWSLGNCFKTEKAAERYKEYLEAIATVRQDEAVLTPEKIYRLGEGSGEVYHIGHVGNLDGEKLLDICAMDLYGMWAPAGAILFETEEYAEASLNNHKEEWKIIASYDWSRE